MQSHTNGPVSPDPINSTEPITKVFTEEFGDTIKVDNVTFLECVIAFKRGVTFRWIRDVDNVPYKIYLKDQNFDQ